MLHSKGKKIPKIKLNSIELTKKLSILLRQEMTSQRWTSKFVANKLNVSERTVKDWIGNKRFPNGINLIKLMIISPTIRTLIWETTQSERKYVDTEMLKTLFNAICDKLAMEV